MLLAEGIWGTGTQSVSISTFLSIHLPSLLRDAVNTFGARFVFGFTFVNALGWFTLSMFKIRIKIGAMSGFNAVSLLLMFFLWNNQFHFFDRLFGSEVGGEGIGIELVALLASLVSPPILFKILPSLFPDVLKGELQTPTGATGS